MAVKKTQLYKSLWDSCDELRGGMDASQYKDYILTLLFMKYVTDKFKGQPYSDLQVFDTAHDPNPDPEKRTGCSFDDFIALKSNKNIGDAYEYLMRNFASESGKSKGQFYTPAEVSRILSKVIGIDRCKSHDASICEIKTQNLIQSTAA